MDPASLFDTAEAWTHEPSVAFTALLTSQNFQRTNRSSSPLPAGHTLRKSSATVYVMMFERFLRHLAARSTASPSLTRSSERDIATFFEGELASASKETFGRYLRLIERVYEHLHGLGIVPVNPVTAWVVAGIRAGNVPGARGRRSSPDFVSAAEVSRLQDWLYTRGRAAINAGHWREARDLVLASLSLGTGMRYAELVALSRRQVKHWPHGPDAERFEFEIPGWASVATARAHRTMAGSMCADLFEAWWQFRWSRRDDLNSMPSGELLFPSTLKGKPLSKATLYKNLASFAKEALAAGALGESSRWVLERGAQGLRRAYVLTELTTGQSPSLLTERLGHWHTRSARRYVEQLQQQKMLQSAPPLEEHSSCDCTGTGP